MVVLVTVAVIASGCDANKSTTAPTTAAPGSAAPGSAAPGSSDGPGPSRPAEGVGTSSQALIAADLASGAITVAQSLEYRAWADFLDPRLPERYDGTGSSGTDESVLADIAAAMPSLTAEEQAVLNPYLLRPDDPASAWSAPGPAAAAPGTVVLAAAAAPAPTTCSAPRGWFPRDWSPNGDIDTGFRVWACDTPANKASAEAADDAVLAIAQKLWTPMTQAEPNGLGLPVSDKGQAKDGGNGKVDIYLLDPFAECRVRGARCDTMPGNVLAMAPIDWPSQCGIAGWPSTGCTGFIVAPRTGPTLPLFPGTLAHEFFHVLQQSHNGVVSTRWYVEASAVWAEFHYVGNTSLFGGLTQEADRDYDYAWAHRFLNTGRDTITWDAVAYQQYGEWLWPLFQDTTVGPEAVFQTWQALEGVSSTTAYDKAIESRLDFEHHLRDFTVRNAQPAMYQYTTMVGLEDDTWQLQQDLDDFPRIPRKTTKPWTTLGLGTTTLPVWINPTDADYEGFDRIDSKVRQITIDISQVSPPEYLDIDVLGELAQKDSDPVVTWRRVKGSGTSVSLCRDNPPDNFDAMELVISNHENQHDSTGLQIAAAYESRGTAVITTSDKCNVPNHFTGTFSGTNGVDSWSGAATFDRYTPDANTTGGCAISAGDSVYCYRIVGGSVTWTVAGVTKQVSLAPPDAADGIQVIVSSQAHPDEAMTYEIGLAPSTEIFITLPNGDHRLAFDTVRAWISVIEHPKYTPDWHLAGTEGSGGGCGIDGCGAGSSWTWDLQGS
jgi:hypothetical protein